MPNTHQTVPAGAPAAPAAPLPAQPLRRGLVLSAYASAAMATLIVLIELLAVEFGLVWTIGGLTRRDLR